ncbi:hypothetical protein Ancab_034622 [Ancistrocladus abbreviatus]
MPGSAWRSQFNSEERKKFVKTTMDILREDFESKATQQLDPSELQKGAMKFVQRIFTNASSQLVIWKHW